MLWDSIYTTCRHKWTDRLLLLLIFLWWRWRRGSWWCCYWWWLLCLRAHGQWACVTLVRMVSQPASHLWPNQTQLSRHQLIVARLFLGLTSHAFALTRIHTCCLISASILILPWLCLPSATSALLCLAAKVCPYSHHMHSLATII